MSALCPSLVVYTPVTVDRTIASHMKRTELKAIRNLLTAKSQPNKGTLASTSAIRARAAQELSAISDTYETAALAGDLIRSALANATEPRDIATLTRALRDVMGVQTEARQEARDTVESMAGQEEIQSRDSLTPPTSSALGAGAVLTDSEILSITQK